MLENILWISAIILQCALAAVLVIRRLHRNVPWFFSYVAFQSISEIILFFVHKQSYIAYFYSYWGREELLAPLELAVLYEVVISVFAPYTAIQRLLRVCAVWALLVLTIVAAFVAINFPSRDSDSVLNAMLVMERSLRIVDVALLLLLFMFAYFLRLRWPHYALGTAIGLGLYSSIELASYAARTAVGPGWTTVFVYINSASFVLALILWNVTFVTAEHRQKVDAGPPSQLQEWNEALETMLVR